MGRKQLRICRVFMMLCAGVAYGMCNDVPTEFRWLDNDDTQTALSKLQNNWRIENIEGPYTNGNSSKPYRRDTLLRKAARNNHIAIVDYLHHHLNISLDKDRRLSKDAPLDAAAEAGHFEMVRHLVDDLGVSVDASIENGCPPQHRVARHGYVSILEFLVNRSQSNLNIRSGEIRSGERRIYPVEEAVYSGHLDIVKYYLEDKKLSPYLPKETLLHDAAEAGSLHIVRYLVETYGMPADYQPRGVDINGATYNGCSPLIRGSGSNKSILKYLIEECRVPVNAVAEDDCTALALAIDSKSYNNVVYLLSFGATPYIRLMTPLEGEHDMFEFSKKLYEICKEQAKDDPSVNVSSIEAINNFLNNTLTALYNGNTDYIYRNTSEQEYCHCIRVAFGQRCVQAAWDLLSRASNHARLAGYALYHAYALQRYAFHQDVKDFIDTITDSMSHAYALLCAIADKEYRLSVAQAVIDTASKETEKNVPYALRSELRRDQVSESVLKYVIYQYPRYMKQSGIDTSTGNTLLHDFVYAKQSVHCFPEYINQCIDDYTAVSRTNNNNEYTPAKLSEEVNNVPFWGYHTIARIPIPYRGEVQPAQREAIPSVIALHIIEYIGYDNMYSLNFQSATSKKRKIHEISQL